MTARNARGLHPIVVPRPTHDDGSGAADAVSADPGTESGEHLRGFHEARTTSDPATPEAMKPPHATAVEPEAPLEERRTTLRIGVDPELLASTVPPTPPPSARASAERIDATPRSRSTRRGTLRLWTTSPSTRAQVTVTPTRRASTPAPRDPAAIGTSLPTPLAPAVARIRPIRVVGEVDRVATHVAGPGRNERETVPDLGTLRRYSVMTPFAIDAPHTGWRWFVGLAVLSLVGSGVLMLFDGL